MPYTEMDNITLAILPSYLNGLGRNATIFLAGTERVAWMVCLHTVVRRVSFAEEPDAGNLQVRFREGRKVLLHGRILWHSSIEREEKQRIQSMPK